MRRSAHILAKRSLQAKARTSSSAAPCQPYTTSTTATKSLVMAPTSPQEANGSKQWSPLITIDNINPQMDGDIYVRSSSTKPSSLGFTVACGSISQFSGTRENDGDHVPCTKSSNQVVETSLGSTRHMISVTFVDKNGDEKSIKVPLGMSMLEAAHQNDIELEGACEGSLACSTCHVIVMDEKFYSKLPEPTDEENDMLDLAFGLTETSLLKGCKGELHVHMFAFSLLCYG